MDKFDSSTMEKFADLDDGVFIIFRPSDADLVGYLRKKISPTSSTYKPPFPEIPIYGKDGMPPWEIWRLCPRYMYQDFIYFFSPAEKTKGRQCRQVGTDGYTWSAADGAKPISVSGNEVGSIRRYRFEMNQKKRKEQDEHHGAWLMDEYTIKQAPHMALCRIKMNDRGGDRSKRKNIEEDDIVTSKKSKLDPTTSVENTTSSSHEACSSHQDDQLQLVDYDGNQPSTTLPSSSPDQLDEIANMLMSDDEDITFAPTAISLTDAQLWAWVAQSIPDEQHQQQEQYSDCAVVPSSSSQEPDQASSSHSNEQQLVPGNDFIWEIDFDDVDNCLQYMNGCSNQQRLQSTLP